MKKRRTTEDRDRKRAEARTLRRDGLNDKEIAARLAVSPATVYYWFHPERYREQCFSRPARPRTGKLHTHGNESKLRARDGAARLAEIPPDHRSLTGVLLGDPLPGRSALDRRNQTAGNRP